MAVSMCVSFEIGHTAKLRAKKTPEGFTHDWELYVQGSNKADISAYVDKVVFNLHESFQRPKRVVKEPPYVIRESGYAGFNLNIDIYFRNRDEPKKVQYTYDLDLLNHGPPHHRSEEKKFIFESPTEEFRQKLLKGGGVPLVPAGLTGSRNTNSNIPPSSFSDSNSSSNIKHKNINSNLEGSGTNTANNTGNSNRKHKSRLDDSKLNTFANLFGTPDTNLTKSSTGIASKTTADTLKLSSGSGSSKIYSPSASSNNVKEKSSKESKDKSLACGGSIEKSKDKSERKEKHKSASNLSPTKEARLENKKLTDSTKSEKRIEDKPKKDKSRDKERDRSSRSEMSTNAGNTPNSVSLKSSTSSKNSGGSASTTPVPLQPTITNIAATNTSAQRTAMQPQLGVTNRNEEKLVGNSNSKHDKSEKETKEKHSNSSSSGKKSKKEKKEKDRDKDKDKERDKEKRNVENKLKDDRSNISTVPSNLSNSPSGHLTPNTQMSSAALQKSTPTSSKKVDKEGKQDALKAKSSISNEKATEKQGTPTPTAVTDKKTIPTVNSGNASSSNNAPKTHKHKKKDKNKEKDKERNNGGDKEKDKLKDKHNKNEEKRETEKPIDVSASKSISPELKKTSTAITSNTLLPQAHGQSNNVVVPTAAQTLTSSKKSLNKEKKSKDSKSSKDPKKRSETSPSSSEPKNKINKTSTPLSTAGSNIEYSDADSRQSTTHDSIKTAPPVLNSTAPIVTEAPDLHSDSSYSSFPEIPVKSAEVKTLGPSPSAASPEKITNRTKENRQREKEKDKDKNATKSSSEFKASKADKEEKKRRRNTMNTTPSETTTFVEPPLKQAKKEQSKGTSTTARDITKSPLPRNNTPVVTNSVSSTNTTKSKNQTESNNQDVDITTNNTNNTTILSPNSAVGASAAASNTIANHANNIINNSAQPQRTTPLPQASPALNNETIWPNLSELQELHRKIMTVQDNDDLQQIVEMIAASGCYELTQRTFDFDLCKLDRSTVERLQEFFATSVS